MIPSGHHFCMENQLLITWQITNLSVVWDENLDLATQRSIIANAVAECQSAARNTSIIFTLMAGARKA